LSYRCAWRTAVRHCQGQGRALLEGMAYSMLRFRIALSGKCPPGFSTRAGRFAFRRRGSWADTKADDRAGENKRCDRLGAAGRSLQHRRRAAGRAAASAG